MLKTEHRVSSGGVVFTKSVGAIKVLLISREKGSIWCLPKGHIDKGETEQQTALREVREETGVEAKLVEKIGDINYWFVWEDTKIHKIVHFYLMLYLGGSTEDHDSEVDEARWFPIEEAIGKLSYENEIEIMKKARKMIRDA